MKKRERASEVTDNHIFRANQMSSLKNIVTYGRTVFVSRLTLQRRWNSDFSGRWFNSIIVAWWSVWSNTIGSWPPIMGGCAHPKENATRNFQRLRSEELGWKMYELPFAWYWLRKPCHAWMISNRIGKYPWSFHHLIGSVIIVCFTSLANKRLR